MIVYADGLPFYIVHMGTISYGSDNKILFKVWKRVMEGKSNNPVLIYDPINGYLHVIFYSIFPSLYRIMRIASTRAFQSSLENR